MNERFLYITFEKETVFLEDDNGLHQTSLDGQMPWYGLISKGTSVESVVRRGGEKILKHVGTA